MSDEAHGSMIDSRTLKYTVNAMIMTRCDSTNVKKCGFEDSKGLCAGPELSVWGVFVHRHVRA